jgi:hypothetical protein
MKIGSHGIVPVAYLTCHLLLSCGAKQTAAVPPISPEFPLTDPLAKPAAYAWDDPDCIEYPAISSLVVKSALLTKWTSEGFTEELVPMADYLDERGHPREEPALPGSISALDVYNRTCQASGDLSSCKDPQNNDLGWSVQTSGKKPRFCRQDGVYSRDSIERVTLSSIIGVQRARDFFSNYVLPARELRGIEIKILPTFETIWPGTAGSQGSRGVLVSNVAYFPAEKQGPNPFIAVFPRKDSDDEKSPRMWESSFIMAHELAHHAERALKLDHFGESRTLMRRAVSEAFADLLAFSATNLKDVELRKMPCLKNRAVTNSVFSDGVEKTFDKALMTSLNRLETNFKSPSNIRSSDLLPFEPACAPAGRLQPHDLGGIIAFAFYDLVNSAFDALNTDTVVRPKKFAEAAVFWLKEIELNIGAGADSSTDVLKIGQALEKTVYLVYEDSGSAVLASQARVYCQKMGLRFAGIGAQRWFGLASCN